MPPRADEETQLEFDFGFDLENVRVIKDDVNHPYHYTAGGIEVYDFIKAWDLSFAEGNVVKYTVRAPHKRNRLEDLKKARWYLDQLIKEAEDDLL
jgi:hypothetical protein